MRAADKNPDNLFDRVNRLQLTINKDDKGTAFTNLIRFAFQNTRDFLFSIRNDLCYSLPTGDEPEGTIRFFGEVYFENIRLYRTWILWVYILNLLKQFFNLTFVFTPLVTR